MEGGKVGFSGGKKAEEELRDSVMLQIYLPLIFKGGVAGVYKQGNQQLLVI